MSASSTPTVRPAARERGGEVDGDRRLADAALAAGDREHAAWSRAISVASARSRAFQRAWSIGVGLLLRGHLAVLDASRR